ncbi:nucleotidyltransferase family protein [Paenibacillus sp. SN-8-1]|uniref:nucleotidyltransferase family protein n=1 Tax=Paenibacillus sp. SN-8-1 TaxID=3435409 RepID=UPI003D9A9379
MILRTEADIIQLVEQDNWMMGLLHAAAQLHLPDWWICAGAVRAKVWDVLHGYHERTPLADIDVIYFDPMNLDEGHEKDLEQKLLQIRPNLPWSVKNQARMHKINNLPPYHSSIEGISKFPETATSIGISLNSHEEVILTAPWGIQDLIHLRVQPTPFFQATPERARIYEDRVRKKNWACQWPQLTIFSYARA